MAGALLSLLLVGTAQGVAAYTPPNEHQSGSIGPYDFRDYAYGSHEGNIDCVYRQLSNGDRRLKQFKVHSPRAWWPDTDADNDDQHGTVGDRYRIQEASDPDGSWTTVYSSSIQKRTAHEGAYDTSVDADFSGRSLDWSSSKNVVYRVKVTIYWYKSNGDVRGSIDHWYALYDTLFYPFAAEGYCSNKISAI